jgi:hypothetical protein
MDDISSLIWDKVEQKDYTQIHSQIGKKKWEHACHLLAFEVCNQVRYQVQIHVLGQLQDDYQ